MLLDLRMPGFGDRMAEGTVHRLLIEPGARVDKGTRLFEVFVDLSAIAEQNCAPVFFFRIVAAESGWCRSVAVKPGDRRAVGEILALVSTTPDEAPESITGDRGLRISVATVLE